MFITELLAFDFFRNALMAAFLTSILCGIIGSLVVVRRIVIVAGGVGHAAYGGVGLSLFLHFPPQLGALLFSAATSLLLGWLLLKDEKRSDTIIGVIWAIGMAIGILFTDLTPGYSSELMTYLLGSILTVSQTDLILMLTIVVTSIALVARFYPELVAMLYDRDFALLRGVPVIFFHYALILLISISVVLVIRVIGLILVLALLTIPAHMAEKSARSLAHMMFLAVCYSLFFSFAGILISVRYNLTAGASIVLVAGMFYLLAGIFSFNPLTRCFKKNRETESQNQL